MEYGQNNVSDKDRKMMDAFERFDDDDDDEETPKKKKESVKQPSPFEKVKEDVKAETTGERANIATLVKENDETKRNEAAEIMEDLSDLGELANDETKIVVQETVTARNDELQTELDTTGPGSIEAAPILADAAFIETLSRKLPTTEMVNQALIDEAFAEIVKDLELPEEAIELEELGLLEPPATNIEVVAPLDEAEVQPETILPAVTPSVNGKGTTKPPGQIPLSSIGSSSAAPTSVGGSLLSGTGSGSGTPQAPISGGGGLPPLGLPVPGNVLKFPSPNVAPITPNVVDSKRHNRGADLLVGGIIGYLIGRRRGRIKTEERLVPVQKKLEKQVEDLQAQITTREEKIRKLVTQKIEQQPKARQLEVAEEVTAKLQQKQPERVSSSPVRIDIKATPPERSAAIPGDIEESTVNEINSPAIIAVPIEAKSFGEAVPLAINLERNKANVITQPEKLGRVILPAPEIHKESRTEIRAEAPKAVENLSVTELLTEASHMTVEGVKVKTLYETGRIDKDMLKRAVNEHKHGRSYERIVSEKLQTPGTPEHFAAEELEESMSGRPGTQKKSAVLPGDSASTLNPTNRVDLAAMPLSQLPSKPVVPTKSRAKTGWIIVLVILAAAVALIALV